MSNSGTTITYGRLIAAVFLAAYAMASTLPGRTHGMGLITEGILADLTISRTDYATLNLVATLIGAVFCWPCGWMIDRIGLRVVSLATLAALGVCTIGTGINGTLLGLWFLTIFTRGFGQSMLSIVSLTMIGKSSVGRWQPHAMACYSLAVSILFIVAFVVMGEVIPAYGWRRAWIGLGCVILISAPVFLWLVNDVEKADSTTNRTTIQSATVQQALCTPAFWIFAAGASLYAFVSSGLSLFNQSILRENQFGEDIFFRLLSVSTMAGTASNLIAGALVQRVTYRKLLSISMAVYTLALIAFPWIRSESGVMFYGIAMGVSGGIVTVIFFGVWSYAYGRDHLGKIQGIAQLLTVLASATGPLFFAKCTEWFGSYQPAFWGLAPTVALISLAAWFVPLPVASTTEGKQEKPDVSLQE